ncbi:MAG: hypothetical protein HUU35_18180 [Armatimonadetes bacterium]|nr:hypothetical protein [Armatimonadota bacterium]
MSEHETAVAARAAAPPGLRMVLYGALFALLLIMLGLLARERREAAAAKPFPSADGAQIMVTPGP